MDNQLRHGEDAIDKIINDDKPQLLQNLLVIPQYIKVIMPGEVG
jgi:hypothetical protein